MVPRVASLVSERTPQLSGLVPLPFLGWTSAVLLLLDWALDYSLLPIYGAYPAGVTGLWEPVTRVIQRSDSLLKPNSCLSSQWVQGGR